MRIIGEMGHTDGIVIADAGLPVPLNVERVDLSLVAGVPSFLETLHAIMNELCVERSLIATEMKSYNPVLYGMLTAGEPVTAIPDFSAPPHIDEVPHIEFKRVSTTARAVVRTAEITPFANIILFSGVTFA